MKKWIHSDSLNAVFVLDPDLDIIRFCTSSGYRSTKMSEIGSLRFTNEKGEKEVVVYSGVNLIWVKDEGSSMTFVPNDPNRANKEVFPLMVCNFTRLKIKHKIWALNTESDVAMFKILFDHITYEFDD